jgi:Leucine-rich repeat (LRR) protein
MYSRESSLEFCEEHGIEGYTIHDDGTIDVDDDVDISSSGLEVLTVKFGVVHGEFNAGYNNLTSFIGFPTSVTRSLYCESNQIRHFKHCPSIIGGDFSMSENKINNFDDFPQMIGGDIYLNKNNFTKLDNMPEIAHGSLFLNSNYLTTLEGCPKEIGGGLSADHCQLTNLKGLPEKIGGGIIVYKNQLTSLEGLPEVVNGTLNLAYNRIKTIEHLPKEVRDNLIMDENNITDLYGFRTKITGDGYLRLNKNPVNLIWEHMSIESIKVLNMSKCIVGDGYKLKNLKWFYSLMDKELIDGDLFRISGFYTEI